MKRILVWIGIPCLFLGVFFARFAFQIPSESEMRGCLVTKMAEVNLCPGSKTYAPLNTIAPSLQRAVVMSEDASFWNHRGFDWESLEKSARENWEKGRYKRGGSTITQQLVKNMFLTKEKTITRKLLEAIITYRIERTLNKKEILERYLNVIEFGRDIYGVKAAARHYFQKSPGALTAVESAFLAMLLPNPKKYSRSHQTKSLTPFARQRIRRILSDMAKTGKLSADEYALAGGEMEYFLGGEAPAQKTPDAPNVESAPADESGSDAGLDPELDRELEDDSAEDEDFDR